MTTELQTTTPTAADAAVDAARALLLELKTEVAAGELFRLVQQVLTGSAHPFVPERMYYLGRTRQNWSGSKSQAIFDAADLLVNGGLPV